jgi:peptidoglycan/xylan/chitin deacetylase (PgdA/CDA1 family)
MAGTILVGYDTETAAVGEVLSLFTESPNFPLYALALDPDTCREALEVLTGVHADAGVPATLFVCGRTLLHALEPVQKAHASGLFDIQQHTFSHVPFKDIEYSPEPGNLAKIPASPPVALLEELRMTSRLLRDHVGTATVGLRPPFGYYRGLRDRPDLLEIVRKAGLRYVTSWGRNADNGNPSPWDVQPFSYEEEGYPDIFEIPFQFWLDVIWFDQHGYDSGPAYLDALKGAVDVVAEQDIVYGACFHDWVAIASDERKTGWLRGFFTYAKEKGVEVTTYTDYWRRATGG